uniref:CCHC-type domain-containing protein n=1 Tax=Ditylenchus dipsaci TaxID=166011 RepID=A0A915D3H5_9BILA
MLAVNLPSTSSRIIYFAVKKVLPITAARFSSESYETKCVDDQLPEGYSSASPVRAQSKAAHTPIPSSRSMRCTNCSAQGHYSFECPLPSKYFQEEESKKDMSTISSEGVTFIYPEENTPPNKADKASTRCTNCSAIGHYSFECEQPEKCKHCQSTDHFHAHCPQQQKEPPVNDSFPYLDEQAISQPMTYHTKHTRNSKTMLFAIISLTRMCIRNQKTGAVFLETTD